MVSPAWKEKLGAGTSVQWPAGLGGEGNDGVSGLVKSAGAIGYVELAYANQNRLALDHPISVEIAGEPPRLWQTLSGSSRSSRTCSRTRASTRTAMGFDEAAGDVVRRLDQVPAAS
jgi:hypothetical protein